MELNKIYCGDSLRILKTFPDESIDCVVTSPPYNKAGHLGFIHTPNPKRDSWVKGRTINYNNDPKKDFIPEEQYQQGQIEILNEIHRLLKNGGSVAYNHKVRVKNHIATFPTDWLQKTKLKIQQEIIWNRGSSPAIDTIRFLPTTEKIYWMFKGNKPKYFNKNMAKLSEVWRINADFDNDHPAPFPLQIADRCVSAFSREEEIVLDCFMGSGTTALACIKRKRNYIGIELEKSYCKMAEMRIKNELAQTTLNF